MRMIIALVCGVIFGLGLTLSDMIDPARVLAFLDVAGHWDPTLAFVMVGALIPASIGFAITRHLTKPALGDMFQVPRGGTVDGRLLAGATFFGIGWGLVGLCPGPAIADLAIGGKAVWIFIAAMIGGMAVHRTFEARSPGPLSARQPHFRKGL